MASSMMKMAGMGDYPISTEAFVLKAKQTISLCADSHPQSHVENTTRLKNQQELIEPCLIKLYKL